MSTNIREVNNNILTWGYNAVFNAATYASKAAQATASFAKTTFNRLYTGRSINDSLRSGYIHCDELHWEHNILNSSIKQAKHGTLPKMTTHEYIDLGDRTLGLMPKLKRVHTVNDRQMIEELLHTKRGDQLLDSGFHGDLAPLVTSDTMLLCPYAQHRSLRSPLEKTFKAASIQGCIDSMLLLGMNMMIDQVNRRQEMLEPFVFASIVIQALGMELTEKETQELAALFGRTPDEKEKVRHVLEKFIDNLFKQRLFKAGGGMDCLNASKMSQSQKISAAILMFEAGMHTTTHLMQLFLATLDYSQYNEKIYQEWKRFIADKPEASTQKEKIALFREFIQSSDLLHCCYLELMRLYPVIPIIKRVAKKDFRLGDTYIRVGDEIQLNVMATQRDANQWENANTFCPERFKGYLNKKSAGLLNFGVGSQSCIGKYLAETEVKMIGALFSIFMTRDPKIPILVSNAEKNEKINKNFMHMKGFNIKSEYRERLTSSMFMLREEWKTQVL